MSNQTVTDDQDILINFPSSSSSSLSGAFMPMSEVPKPHRRCNLKPLWVKIWALREVDKGVLRKTQIAKICEVPSNTLSTWLKNREKIFLDYQRMAASGAWPGDFQPTLQTLSAAEEGYDENPEPHRLEERLYDWYAQEVSKGNKVSWHKLGTAAYDLADNMGIGDFVCTAEWMEDVVEHYQIMLDESEESSSDRGAIHGSVSLQGGQSRGVVRRSPGSRIPQDRVELDDMEVIEIKDESPDSPCDENDITPSSQQNPGPTPASTSPTTQQIASPAPQLEAHATPPQVVSPTGPAPDVSPAQEQRSPPGSPPTVTVIQPASPQENTAPMFTPTTSPVELEATNELVTPAATPSPSPSPIATPVPETTPEASEVQNTHQVSVEMVATQNGTKFCVNQPGQMLHDTMLSLWQQEILTDVIIMTPTGPVCMHKVVWASHSRKFLCDLNVMQKVDPNSKLMVSVNSRRETVKKVLDFMYQGELEINTNTLGSIREAATELNADLILQICDMFKSSLEESNQQNSKSSAKGDTSQISSVNTSPIALPRPGNTVGRLNQEDEAVGENTVDESSDNPGYVVLVADSDDENDVSGRKRIAISGKDKLWHNKIGNPKGIADTYDGGGSEGEDVLEGPPSNGGVFLKESVNCSTIDSSEHFKCKECITEFNRTVFGLAGLIRHYHCDHAQEPFVKCLLCGSVYSAIFMATHHVKTDHKAPEDMIVRNLELILQPAGDRTVVFSEAKSEATSRQLDKDSCQSEATPAKQRKLSDLP